MSSSDTRPDLIGAACLMLATVQAVMLASLYFGVEPHPPRTIPLFAMPPFLAVSIGTALCAYSLSGQRPGRILAGVAAVAALLSFGPQKYVDPAIGDIWIAVVASQIAMLVIVWQLITTRDARAEDGSAGAHTPQTF